MTQLFDIKGMNSGELKYQANLMVSGYKSAVRHELREMVKTYEERGSVEEVCLELSRIISSNQSRWSGGNSISNVCEQILREEANNLLTDLLRRKVG